MDSQLTSPETRAAVGTTTKIHPLVQSKSVLCGTGNAQLVMDWYSYINLNILANDIDVLERMTKKAIEQFIKCFQETRDSIPSGKLYHFGYSVEKNLIRGFVITIKDGIDFREIEYGWGFLPTAVFRDEELFKSLISKSTTDNQFDVLKFLFDAMCEMRSRDANAGLSDKVGIGGEFHLLSFTEMKFNLKSIPFDDYEEFYINCSKSGVYQ
jgi:hypothetical protein